VNIRPSVALFDAYLFPNGNYLFTRKQKRQHSADGRMLTPFRFHN